MTLEDVTLSEQSRSQKDNYSVFLLEELFRRVKFMETECRRAVTRGQGDRGMGSHC